MTAAPTIHSGACPLAKALPRPKANGLPLLYNGYTNSIGIENSIPGSVAKRAHKLSAIRASGNRLSAAEGKVILSASPTC